MHFSLEEPPTTEEGSETSGTIYFLDPNDLLSKDANSVPSNLTIPKPPSSRPDSPIGTLHVPSTKSSGSPDAYEEILGLLRNLQPLMGPSQQRQLQALQHQSPQIQPSSYPNGPPPSTPHPNMRIQVPSPPIQMSNIDDPDTDFFNYTNLPSEVKERIMRRTDPTKYTLGNSMTRFRNSSTVNSRGDTYECNFILHPPTSKKWLVTDQEFSSIYLQCQHKTQKHSSPIFLKCWGIVLHFIIYGILC